MKNKIFARIIITTLLVTFLTFNVGRVTSAYAMGTTIAVASGAALLSVGIIYCSYMALTGASIHVPDAIDDIQSWLTDMGTKVVQYPSGRAAYEEIYPELIGIGDEPLTSLLDRAWTWTADKLKSWANDFSSVDVIQNIASYTIYPDIDTTATTDYDYSFTFVSVPNKISYSVSEDAADYVDFDTFISVHGGQLIFYDGARVLARVSTTQRFLMHTNIHNPVRNYLNANGKYIAQQYINDTWTEIGQYQSIVGQYVHGNSTDNITFYYPYGYCLGNGYVQGLTNWDFPPLADADIYDSVNDVVIPATQSTAIEQRNPQYPSLPPEDDNKPLVIPYVKLPFDPNWIDPITNLPTGGGNWGLNLRNLLNALEDLSGTLMEIGAIGELINQFKNLLSGQAGDEYYIYYDDSEHDETFYQYYTITNYNGDVYQYDIDVSDSDEHLPVDLNTIQVYTDNNYVNTVKGHARKFGEAIGEYVAFWHNSDPESLYTILGSFVVILIGAFIGKWGHS